MRNRDRGGAPPEPTAATLSTTYLHQDKAEPSAGLTAAVGSAQARRAPSASVIISSDVQAAVHARASASRPAPLATPQSRLFPTAYPPGQAQEHRLAGCRG